jgi:hypothetical protein
VKLNQPRYPFGTVFYRLSGHRDKLIISSHEVAGIFLRKDKYCYLSYKDISRFPLCGDTEEDACDLYKQDDPAVTGYKIWFWESEDRMITSYKEAQGRGIKFMERVNRIRDITRKEVNDKSTE